MDLPLFRPSLPLSSHRGDTAQVTRSFIHGF